MFKGNWPEIWPIRLGLLPVLVPAVDNDAVHGLVRPRIGICNRVVTAKSLTAWGLNMVDATVHVPRRPLLELCEVSAFNLTGDSRGARSVRWNDRVITLDGERVRVLEASIEQRQSLVGRCSMFSFDIHGDGVDLVGLTYRTTRHVDGWLGPQAFFRASGQRRT